LLVARGGDLLARRVQHFGYVERVIQFEGGGGDVIVNRGETDRNLGIDGLGGGRNLGFDGVPLDINAGGAPVLGVEGNGAQSEREGSRERRGAKRITKHE
jgi:hypothetical protein